MIILATLFTGKMRQFTDLPKVRDGHLQINVMLPRLMVINVPNRTDNDLHRHRRLLTIFGYPYIGL